MDILQKLYKFERKFDEAFKLLIRMESKQAFDFFISSKPYSGFDQKNKFYEYIMELL